MTPSLGLILTSAHTLDAVRRHVAAGRLDVLKVVTGWGLPQPWDNATRHAAARIAPQLIVRTMQGDPSLGPERAMPHAHQVVAEVAPWYEARDPGRPFWVEVGNEPLLDPQPSEDAAWDYAWHLANAVRSLRARFPQARIIGPAQMLNHAVRLGESAWGQERWVAIAADALRRCDALGLHAYSLEQYARGLRHLRTHVGAEPVWVTEFGLNEAMDDAARGQALAGTIRQLAAQGVCLYHLADLPGDDPVHFNRNYRLSVPTLAALSTAWTVPPAPPRPVPPAAPRVISVPMTREHLTRGRAHGPVRALVLHATAGRFPSDFGWLRAGGDPKSPVSCHYYIDKRGAVSQFVADHDTAWHAGASTWRGLEVRGSLNARSIGVELENRNTGRDPYPEAQVAAAVALARHLVSLHGIERANLVRHLDISPGRKTDPAGFPWGQFVADVYEGR